jgi:hypothetical protein
MLVDSGEGEDFFGGGGGRTRIGVSAASGTGKGVEDRRGGGSAGEKCRCARGAKEGDCFGGGGVFEVGYLDGVEELGCQDGEVGGE